MTILWFEHQLFGGGLKQPLAHLARKIVWVPVRYHGFFTVLRQAMAGDGRDPAGIYFGTNSGLVFASANEGDDWQEIAQHLPTILAVEVLERK